MLRLVIASIIVGVAVLSLSPVSSAMTVSDCGVLGCGVLGTSLCKQIVNSPEFSSWKVTGITKTKNNHESIVAAIGTSKDFVVKTEADCRGEKFRNVVFCAPPSGFEDYPGALKDAMTNLWCGPSEGGVFVFTSSGGIYGPGTSEIQIVAEDSAVAEDNPRSAKLIAAEEVVRNNGGACLRLAGLYTLERGAHSFWLKSGKDVSGRADGIINLLHYDDAAGSVMAALSVGPAVVSGRNFLISDGNPVTRKQIVESALKAQLFQSGTMPHFSGSEEDPIGKIYDGAASNAALKWTPRYESFDAFMSSHAE